MRIGKLTLNNFQGIKTLTIDLAGKSAAIYGDNATGKTTVYNALTWLLFDKASTGAKGFTPKTKGPDGDLHNLEHSVEAVLIEGGAQRTLKKVYKEKYKKKRGSAHEEFSGHTVDYYIDGVPAKEKEYNSAIELMTGGDAEKPKILTMPDYFPEKLPWDKRREILLEVCGDISEADIIAATPELKDLPDFLRMTGTEEKSYTIAEYQKIAKARLAEINKQLNEIPGRIDEAELAIPDTEGLDEKQLEANIEALESKKENLLKLKMDTEAGGFTAQLRKERAELEAEQAEKRAAFFSQQKPTDYSPEINVIQRRAAEIRNEIQTLESARQMLERDALLIEETRSSLIAEYKRVQAETMSEESETCPTCHRKLPEGEIASLRAAFHKRKSERLIEINRKGKEEASASIIRSKQEEAEKAAARIEELKAELEHTESELAEFRVKEIKAANEAPKYSDTTECKEYEARIAEINQKLADETESRARELETIEARIQAINDAIRNERDKIMQLTLEENQRRRIKELEKTEKSLGAEYEETEKGLHLCEEFIKAKVAALTDRINLKFKKVRFQLFQEQLNGGIKEDCEPMIRTKTGRLVPYTFANNAARINAGLEIIEVLAEHWGIEMPLFIDNAESVTSLIETKVQKIRLVVSPKDKALRVETEDE
ncbi:MAG: AAA family ATPase [Ruminococcus sp.]